MYIHTYSDDIEIKFIHHIIMITYNQKVLWTNWCTYVSICTNLSNLFNRQLSLWELQEWYSYVWLSWSWWLPSTIIKKATERWSKKFSKVSYTMLTIGNGLKKCKEWKMIYIWFRRDVWMFMDTQDNWRIDRVPPIGEKEWWHSCNLIWDWIDYVILDNYDDRKYKEYKISEDVMNKLINNRVIRATCYYFSKWRMLQIPK